MKMTTPEGNELINVESIDVQDRNLVIRGMIMGAMPMTSMISPSEMRAGLKLLSMRKISKVILLLFRR